MPDFDVCVVGEINLDLILYGLPKELVLDRELLATGLSVTLGSSSAIFAHNLAMLREQGRFRWENRRRCARENGCRTSGGGRCRRKSREDGN